MKREASGKRRISPAAASGWAALLATLIAAVRAPGWAFVPPAAFIIACLTAPFVVSKGFFLPVVSRGNLAGAHIALTFDDGPDPETTGPLLKLLDRYGIKAAFFVTGKNAEKHGELIRAILDRGHEIGNHSYRHDPFLMLRRAETIDREIESTQKVLKKFGILPRAFRPPVGITNPKLGKILLDQGLYCLNFSRRGNDFGNRRIRGLALRVLTKIKPNDIVLLHDIRPEKNGICEWLREIDIILAGLKEKGLKPVILSDLIRRPVMDRSKEIMLI